VPVVDAGGQQQRHRRRLLGGAAHRQARGAGREQRLGDAVAQGVGAGLDHRPGRVDVDGGDAAGGVPQQLVVEQAQEPRGSTADPSDAVRHARRLHAH
jgi:hypothetical protein